MSQQDYQIGRTALAKVVETLEIKANVPAWALSMVAAHQVLIDKVISQGAAAVIDTVEAAHTRQA